MACRCDKRVHDWKSIYLLIMVSIWNLNFSANLSKFKLINQFMESDETVTRILKAFEIHIVAVLNPDGYEYSRASKVASFVFCKQTLFLWLYILKNLSSIAIGERIWDSQELIRPTMRVMVLILIEILITNGWVS